MRMFSPIMGKVVAITMQPKRQVQTGSATFQDGSYLRRTR